jgi:uncharacterized protein (DUF736 family)
MTAIGFVTRTIDGGFRGQFKLLPICADIDIVPNRERPVISPRLLHLHPRDRDRIRADSER